MTMTNYDESGDSYHQHIEDGNVTEVAHSDAGMETSAKIDESRVAFAMSGKPPQNEQGNQRVAQLLSEALSERDRAQWTADPSPPPSQDCWVDWNLKDPARTVWPVQITRLGPTDRWAQVRGTGVAGALTAREAAKEIAVAIQRKLPAQDPRMILALSAGQPGFCIFAEVITEFRLVYLPDLRPLLRFAQIWLVGYSLETTIVVWPVSG